MVEVLWLELAAPTQSFRTASLLPHETVEKASFDRDKTKNHRDEPQAPVMKGGSAHLLNWHILGARKQVLCVGYLVPRGFVSRITLASLWRASSAETVAAAVQCGQSVIRS
jgi:hypothetical protein